MSASRAAWRSAGFGSASRALPVWLRGRWRAGSGAWESRMRRPAREEMVAPCGGPSAIGDLDSTNSCRFLADVARVGRAGGRPPSSTRVCDALVALRHSKPGGFGAKALVANIVERGRLGLGTAARRLGAKICRLDQECLPAERGWRRPEGRGATVRRLYSAASRLHADWRPRLSASSS